jgi:hypothetical protein
MSVKYVLDTKFDTFCSKKSNQRTNKHLRRRSNHLILKDFTSNFSSTELEHSSSFSFYDVVDRSTSDLSFLHSIAFTASTVSVFLFSSSTGDVVTLLLTLAFDGTACCHFERGESEDCLFPPPLRDITPISPWGPLQIVTEITFCLLPNVFTENVKWFSHRYSFNFPYNFCQ